MFRSRSGPACSRRPPITFDRASGPLRGALIGAMIFEGLVAGTGQVGAGLVTPTMECFTAAIHGLAAARVPLEGPPEAR